jgi:hypothetical protein
LAAVTRDEVTNHEGPEVDVRFVHDEQQQWREVAELLETWTDQGIRPGDIAVLASSPRPPAQLVSLLRTVPSPVLLERHDALSPLWVSAEDFKGLESTAAIVTDVGDLETPLSLRRVYVACSRARTLLAVLIAESAHETFNRRAAEYALRDPQPAL